MYAMLMIVNITALNYRKIPTEPPIVRYMFWDVVSDFEGIDLPYVPTLSKLKSANKYGAQGLRGLANAISSSISEITTKSIKDAKYNRSIKAMEADLAGVDLPEEDSLPEGSDWSVMDNIAFGKEVEANIAAALNDDNFLNQALAHSRQSSIRYLNNLLINIKEDDCPLLEIQRFVKLMQSAISTSDLELVSEFFQLPQTKHLPNKSINQLLEFARQYDNQAIIDYLERQKELGITARLAFIDQALTELRTKVTDINQFHWATAYAEANGLLLKLESSRTKYRDKLEQEEFNVALESSFKEECVTAIRIARPILENDLYMGAHISKTYLKSLLTESLQK